MANLMPWRSRTRDGGEFAPVMRLRSEMDRLFDRFFDTPLGGLESLAQQGWMPSLDVCDNEKELVLCAEVPGMHPDDIEISVTGNTLTVSGEKKESKEDKDRGYYHSERRFGRFYRSIELPAEVDPEKISADYSNGVLTIRVPKTEAQQPRKIAVNTDSPVKKQQVQTQRSGTNQSKQ